MSKKIENQKIEKSELKTINLSDFKASLDAIPLKESRNRELLYIYPEGFDKNKINGLEGKKFRNGLRSKMQKFCNDIFYYAKIEDQKKLMDKIEEFKIHYKNVYRINDFKLSSISNSNNEGKARDIELMLSIIRKTL